MAIRKLETHVVDCDSCDAVYADVVPYAVKTLEKFAARDGWQISENGDLCPACVKAKVERLLAARAAQEVQS